MSVFLIVLSAAGENHLSTVWRVCFGIGVLLPLTVFYFRMRMLTTQLYVFLWFRARFAEANMLEIRFRKAAIKSEYSMFSPDVHRFIAV